MSKHTPGPWTLKHVSGSNFENQRFEIRGMFGDRPATYPIFNKDTSALDGATVCCSPSDARLIAAAPELLEFAEEWLSRQGSDENYMTGKARAAIAKATGGDV